MAETKIFSRNHTDIDLYKSKFKKALKKVEIVNLFDDEVLIFLQNWIENQKSYIPREDVDNFLDNMIFLFKHKEFYKFFLVESKKIDNKNILEYSFNLISLLDDLRIDYEKTLKERKNKLKLEKDLEKSKKQDEEKIKDLEKLFDEI